jgi:AcrR family transcriptional regulator
MARKEKAASAAPGRRVRLSGPARREAILAAAAGVFAEMGYERCRMRDIAARVGVTEPVIFQNFGSKAALFSAVIELAADQLCAALRSTAEGSDVLERILAPGHLDEMHGPGAPGVLFADAMGLTTEPGVEAAARRGLRRVADALAGVIAEGQEAGTVRADVEPATAAWWLLSLLASHRFRSAMMPQRARREQLLAAFTRQVLTEPR